jgi:hypothetical protein
VACNFGIAVVDGWSITMMDGLRTTLIISLAGGFRITLTIGVDTVDVVGLVCSPISGLLTTVGMVVLLGLSTSLISAESMSASGNQRCRASQNALQ